MRILIVGGGILGLATAAELRALAPDSELTILEKEGALALHQTGRNSGVIHSGIYYKPGSAKAINCKLGRARLLSFCQEHDIEHELCGKVIVATKPAERFRLHNLYQQAQNNDVVCRLLSSAELAEIEPCACGLEAIFVKDAGIVDYKGVARALAQIAQAKVVTKAEVLSLVPGADSVLVESTAGSFKVDSVVNCAGLHCDRVARRAGLDPGLQIVPFKGEYFRLRKRAEHLCRHLIYPVPDPQFPFLGVHLTRMIGGGVEVGPNAVLALGREAYGKTDVNFRDLWETLSYPGFLRLASRHWKMGSQELWRSISKKAFVKALRKLCPELKEEDLVPVAPGIRAQALHRDGRLEDDFQIRHVGRTVHLLNAPSPGATASLPIGRTLAKEVLTSRS